MISNAKHDVGAETSSAFPHVEILLATYNGERFLREQLDSLLAQTYTDTKILARDDGSSDRSRSILAEYAVVHPGRIRLLGDFEPTGSPQANFLRLLESTQAPYVAFSDQDDVWLPSKLDVSMQAMRELERRNRPEAPLLVFTDLQLVDQELRVRSASMWKELGISPRVVHHPNRLFGQSVVTGCTMLLNRALVELARRMPSAATMHDRWIALIASCLGDCAYVAQPLVLYRQHQLNVVGARPPDASLAGTLKRLANNSGRHLELVRSERQIEAFLDVYRPELEPLKIEMLTAYIRSGRSSSALERLTLTLKHRFFRENAIKTTALLFDLLLQSTLQEPVQR